MTEITLLGEPADWRQIRARLDVLAEPELEWWTSSLAIILDQLVEASEGKPDRLAGMGGSSTGTRSRLDARCASPLMMGSAQRAGGALGVHHPRRGSSWRSLIDAIREHRDVVAAPPEPADDRRRFED